MSYIVFEPGKDVRHEKTAHDVFNPIKPIGKYMIYEEQSKEYLRASDGFVFAVIPDKEVPSEVRTYVMLFGGM